MPRSAIRCCLTIGPNRQVALGPTEKDAVWAVIAWSGTAERTKRGRIAYSIGMECSRWNDHPDTTLAEVVAIQRAASDLLGERT